MAVKTIIQMFITLTIVHRPAPTLLHTKQVPARSRILAPYAHWKSAPGNINNNNKNNNNKNNNIKTTTTNNNNKTITAIIITKITTTTITTTATLMTNK